MTPAGLVALATRIGNEELADDAELRAAARSGLWHEYQSRRTAALERTESRLHELLNAIGQVAPQLGGGA